MKYCFSKYINSYVIGNIFTGLCITVTFKTTELEFREIPAH